MARKRTNNKPVKVDYFKEYRDKVKDRQRKYYHAKRSKDR